jgi:hypothetical protein
VGETLYALQTARPNRPRAYTGGVGDWYTIGLALGLGIGVGVLLAGLLGGSRAAALGGAALAALAGLGIGFAIEDWTEALGGALGGAAGALAATQVVGGALRRGGTRVGVALIVAGAAAAIALLALIPLVGYIEAVAVPALAGRLRSRSAERYAGLRSLAK